jgi:hypothetical protein
MKAIHPEQYYDSYRLIAGYLAVVDEQFDRPEEATQTVTQPTPPKTNLGAN